MTVSEALPLALEFLGMWKPGVLCPGCRDLDHHYFIGEEDGEPLTESHDIPMPDLTDALAMAMLRALATLTHAPELFTATKNDWHCEIFTDDDHVAVSHPDPAQAIVLAIAALSVSARRPS